MEILGIVSVPAITIICFLIGEAVKASGMDKKWLPVIVGCCGAILGVIAMITMPDFPADNVLLAIAYGIVSGLASTGIHQLFHQFKKDDLSAVEMNEQEGYNDR